MTQIAPALIAAWLSLHGYKEPQIYAINAYIAEESAFNPDDSTPSGHCLFQWVGERHTNLKRWSKPKGQCPPWYVQMAYMDWEVKKEADRYRAFFNARSPALAHRIWRRVFGQSKEWKP